MVEIKGCGARIKEIRESAKLSQTDFAAKINLSAPAVSQLESEARTPALTTVVKIAQDFGVSTDYLLFGAEKGPAGDSLDGFGRLKPRDKRIVKQLVDTILADYED